MDEDRLHLYPIYQEGGLDVLLERVAAQDRFRLVSAATISMRKPDDAGAAQLPVRAECSPDVT